MQDLTLQGKLWEAESYIERQKEENRRLLNSLKDAYVGWACGIDVVSGMNNAVEILMENGIDLQLAREEHKNAINERRCKRGLPEL